jgi:sorting nexin-1/2
VRELVSILRRSRRQNFHFISLVSRIFTREDVSKSIVKLIMVYDPLQQDEPFLEEERVESEEQEEQATPPPPYESIILEDERGANAGSTLVEQGKQQSTSGYKDVGAHNSNNNNVHVPYFEVSVLDPVKQGEGVSAYISYKVVSKIGSNASHTLEQEERTVIRRFRDFTWLRNCLRKECSGIILPPLPPKSVVEKYKMTPEFVEDRRRGLDVFLHKVLSHPVLHTSPELKLFLQASEAEFAIESSRMSTALGSAALAESGGASNLASKTLMTATKFFKSLSDNAGLALSPTISSSSVQHHIRHEETPEYAAIKNYYVHLEAHLNEVHQHAQRLTRQHERMGACLAAFGESLKALSSSDTNSSNNNNNNVGDDYMGRLSSRATNASSGWVQSASELHTSFEGPLRDVLRSVRSAKKTIEDRDDCLVAKIHAQMNVDSKRKTLAKLQSTPGMRQDRVMEAERHVQDALRQSQEATTAYTGLTERMDSDIVRFQEERAKELKSILIQWCDIEQKTHGTVSHAWEGKELNK